MIDDLFTQLVVGAVERLSSRDTSPEEADDGLARLNARLSPPERREETISERTSPTEFDPQLEPRLLDQYLRLDVDDLHAISAGAHEWLLERISNARVELGDAGAATLRNVYLLFPDTTVRHGVIGVLLQADHLAERKDGRKPPAATIAAGIDGDHVLSEADRVRETGVFVDLLLDYVDVLPEETERALAALDSRYRRESLREYLLDWADRLGGEARARIRRVVGESTGERQR